MNAISNYLRVAAAVVWTAVVGFPVVVIAYSRWIVALLARRAGRDELARDLVARNAVTMGSVAQHWWAPVLGRLTRVRVARAERAPIDWSRTHVICANHASIFDIIALAAAVPVPFRFVAKRELLKWPIIGWVLPPSGQIVIDRADRDGAIATIERASLDGVRGQIIFFVEGTRSRDGRLRPFKKGAFHFALDHDLPLLPTAICGSHGVLGRTLWWRMRTGREIEVVFAAPVETGAIGADAPRDERVATAMEQVRAALVAELEPGQRTA